LPPLARLLKEANDMALLFETLLLLLITFGLGLGLGWMIWKDSGRRA
jgi:hypothetical protein